MNLVLTESSTHPRRLPLASEALAVMSILPWAKKAMKEGTWEQETEPESYEFCFDVTTRTNKKDALLNSLMWQQISIKPIEILDH